MTKTIMEGIQNSNKYLNTFTELNENQKINNVKPIQMRRRLSTKKSRDLEKKFWKVYKAVKS